MFDFVIDTINYLSKNSSENATIKWILLLVFVIIVCVFVTYKVTISINKLKRIRIKPLKDKIEELNQQIISCNTKIQELHSKNADLLIKFYSENGDDYEDSSP